MAKKIETQAEYAKCYHLKTNMPLKETIETITNIFPVTANRSVDSDGGVYREVYTFGDESRLILELKTESGCSTCQGTGFVADGEPCDVCNIKSN